MDTVLPIFRVMGRALLGLGSAVGLLFGALLSLGPIDALFAALGLWLFGPGEPADGEEAAEAITFAGIPDAMGADALMLVTALGLMIVAGLGLVVALRGETADVLLERVRELEDRVG